MHMIRQYFFPNIEMVKVGKHILDWTNLCLPNFHIKTSVNDRSVQNNVLTMIITKCKKAKICEFFCHYTMSTTVLTITMHNEDERSKIKIEIVIIINFNVQSWAIPWFFFWFPISTENVVVGRIHKMIHFSKWPPTESPNF